MKTTVYKTTQTQGSTSFSFLFHDTFGPKKTNTIIVPMSGSDHHKGDFNLFTFDGYQKIKTERPHSVNTGTPEDRTSFVDDGLTIKYNLTIVILSYIPEHFKIHRPP